MKEMAHGMKARLAVIGFVLLACLFWVTACAREPEIVELKESEVVFSIQPEAPQAGQQAKLHMELPTLVDTENVDVYYEIKSPGSDNRQIFTAMQYEPGKYNAAITIKQPGTYELYLHIQTIEFHHIYKRSLTVVP
jgi:hypothetical protein